MEKKKLLENPIARCNKKKGTIYTGSRFKACGSTVYETDIYDKGELIVRHFTWNKGWLTYDVRSKLWGTASLEWIENGGNTYYYGSSRLYPSLELPEYKEAILDGDDTYRNAESKICHMETTIRYKKLQTAAGRKQARINDEMRKRTPPLPKDFREFIDKKVIGQRLAVVDEGKIWCTCGKDIKIREKEVTGDKVKCPHCRKVRVVTARKKQILFTKHIQLYQKDFTGGSIERQFEVFYRSKPGYPEVISVSEEVRGFAEFPGDIWNSWRYGQHYGAYGQRQEFWDRKNTSFIHNLARKFVLYDRNLEEFYDEGMTDRMLSVIKAVQDLGIECDWSYVLRYSTDDSYEMIVKSGIPKLATEKATGAYRMTSIVGSTGRLHETLGITRQQLRILRKLNGGSALVDYMQNYRDLKEEDYKFLLKHCEEYDKRVWEGILRHDVPLSHVVTLLNKTTGLTRDNARMYSDYLDMAAHRGNNIKDEIIYRNKRWKEYHDRYVEENRIAEEQRKLEKAKKDAYQKRKQFIGIKKNYKQNSCIFGYEYKDFVFIVPKTYEEIVEEGAMQHNCVGASDRYMLKMANKETFIVFLRKKEDPEKSFYTLEVDYQNIIQAYSAYNRREEWNEVKPVLDRWMRQVKKNAKKIAV